LTAATRELIERSLAGTRPGDLLAETAVPDDVPVELRAGWPAALMPAAVLVPLLERPGGIHALLTERAAGLTHHAGQIAFPGGRVEPEDSGPLAAAVREAGEEIGLPPQLIEPAGYLDVCVTATGFAVVPVVAFVGAGFSARLDVREVRAVFEAPLEHLLDPANHLRRTRRVRGVIVPVYEIACAGRLIWGATAAMLVGFSRRLALYKI
jgi:8-oxo-dGTP pyrophosphatase MutT (NUDIX family)